MSTCIHIPNTIESAIRDLHSTFNVPLETLPKATFVRAWCALSYAFPGLHPDGYWDPDNEWPPALVPYAAEAFRRCDAGELEDEEMYPSDACWSGLYDRMHSHTVDETVRRLEIAAEYGEV
ncbi:MAG: hypothetical protein ABI600_18195 [Luteolibacter sp.]